MEQEPDMTNVVFIDEYPHLLARRAVKQALGQLTLNVNSNPNQLLLFPQEPETPDPAA